jgi:hypothetical protein
MGPEQGCGKRSKARVQFSEAVGVFSDDYATTIHNDEG